MDPQLGDLLTVAGSSVAVLIVTQAVKRWLPEDVVPLFSLALGMFLALLARLALGPITAESLGTALLCGLFGGAAASGIYKAQAPVGFLGAKAGDVPHG